MAVIENITTEIGDVLRIKTSTPIIGIILLSSFVDETDETVTRYFTKTFRYSVDGVNYSDFLPLTNLNLSSIVINIYDTLYLEYLYQRSGSDSSGTLEWDSTTLTGQFETPVVNPFYQESMFYQYLGDVNNICSLSWSVNVLEKLYKKGIIPNYIERGHSDNNADDRDYLDFWRSVTHYFALFVCLARKFSVFYQDPVLLLEYLKQRGLFNCTDELFEDLSYEMSHYYDEIRQRGTVQIIKEKSDSKTINGEYLRMICFDPGDEFIFNFNKNEHIGWNIGNSSPCYKGLKKRLNCNKFYNDEIGDIKSSQLLNSQHCSILEPSDSGSVSDSNSDSFNLDISSSKTDEDGVLQIQGVPNGSKSGIGIYSTDNLIKVNPNISYEISFYVRRKNIDSTQLLRFGCLAYDSNNNVVSLLTVGTLTGNSDFISNSYLPKRNVYYYVRGIIYSTSSYGIYSTLNNYIQGQFISYSGGFYRAKVNIDQSDTIYLPNHYPDLWLSLSSNEVYSSIVTNLNTGNNLQFKSNITKIIPYIYLDNTVDGDETNELLIKDVRVNPLSTPYSKGMIQSSNFIDIWQSNRNQDLSDFKISENARKYLFPYKSFHKINNVEPAF